MRRDSGADPSVSGLGHSTTSRRVTNAATVLAPPAVVQSVGVSLTAPPVVQAYSANVTKNNLLLVMWQGSNGATRGVTDTQSNTWAEIAHVGAGGIGDCSIFWAKAGASGPDTVTVTAGTGSIAFLLYEVSGIAAASPVDKTGTSSSTSAVPLVGVGFSGLASVNDFVMEWNVRVPPGNVATGGVWTDDFSSTIAGGHYLQGAWTVGGTSIATPTFQPGNNESFALSAAAFHP